MKFAKALLLFLMFALVTNAQHHDQTAQGKGKVDLGDISFPTSGPAEAQKHFIQGVLLLHSFEYGRARAEFAEAIRMAPNFAMAYWGDAMTYDHPIWPENDRPGALASLARLGASPAERRTKAVTEREKPYLHPVERLYGRGC